LTDGPFGNIGSDSNNMARRLVTEDAVFPVNLRKLSGVKITAADAAQIDFDD
jgi:hypothetical protein